MNKTAAFSRNGTEPDTGNTYISTIPLNTKFTLAERETAPSAVTTTFSVPDEQLIFIGDSSILCITPTTALAAPPDPEERHSPLL